MISHLINIGFPNNCVSCENTLVRNEKFICSNCLFFIPKSDKQLSINSKTSKLLDASPIFMGASYVFDFDKDGKTQHLMHELKYNSNLKLGVYLGEIIGIDFKEQLQDIDFIVPVPLHPKKLYKRGYNQSELLCQGIKVQVEKEINTNNLKRIKFTETQTKKNKTERIKNIKDAFEYTNNNLFEYKTILLVDDVITTGSTLNECLKALATIKGIRVKVLCLAKAAF